MLLFSSMFHRRLHPAIFNFETRLYKSISLHNYIKEWVSCKLLFISDKTKVILYGSQSFKRRMLSHQIATLDDIALASNTTWSNLVINFTKIFTIIRYIKEISSKTTFFHLRNISIYLILEALCLQVMLKNYFMHFIFLNLITAICC